MMFSLATVHRITRVDPVYDDAKADQLLNERIEKVCRDRLAAPDVVDAEKRHLHGVIAERAIKRILRNDVSKQQLLHGVETVLEFLELILGDFGHDGGSAAGDIASSTPSNAALHRFDGGAR